MATNQRFPDFQGSVAVRATAGDELISPLRVVLGIACLLAVMLMLAAIANVARAQVQKGQDFQFARQLEAPAASQFYANYGGSDTTELVRTAANGS